MSNKTNRKNRTALIVKWPPANEYFTFEELFATNPHFVKITLRVRLNNAADEKTKLVAVIGTKKGDKGRPALVYTMTPVSDALIDKARNNGIEIVSENDLMRVLDIVPTTSSPVNMAPGVITTSTVPVHTS